jgi:hypothetical protein
MKFRNRYRPKFTSNKKRSLLPAGMGSYTKKLLRFISNRAILVFVKTFFSSYRSESLSDLLGAEGCG